MEQQVINSIKSKYTPKLHSHGSFKRFLDSNLEMKHSQVHKYLIMPNYGETLHYHMKTISSSNLSSSILSIGKQLLEALQAAHKAGYVHNDIKPDNILLDGQKLTLIDFGCSTQFMKNGRHIGKFRVPHFKGNYLFASLNQMTFTASSRKDDLVSFCFLMVFLLNNQRLFGDYTGYSESDQFELLKRDKMEMTLDTLCVDKAICIKEFVFKIFSMDFDTKPDYKKLHKLFE